MNSGRDFRANQSHDVRSFENTPGDARVTEMHCTYAWSVSEAFLPSEERRYTSMSSNVVQLPILACANGRH
jgi:hypothetical protein